MWTRLTKHQRHVGRENECITTTNLHLKKNRLLKMPSWTRSRYNGFLKTSVKNHINEDSEGQERNKSSSSSSEEEMEYE